MNVMKDLDHTYMSNKKSVSISCQKLQGPEQFSLIHRLAFVAINLVKHEKNVFHFIFSDDGRTTDKRVRPTKQNAKY